MRVKASHEVVKIIQWDKKSEQKEPMGCLFG